MRYQVPVPCSAVKIARRDLVQQLVVTHYVYRDRSESHVSADMVVWQGTALIKWHHDCYTYSMQGTS